MNDRLGLGLGRHIMATLRWLLLLGLGSVGSVAIAASAAQSGEVQIPRLADGKPDLNGVWQVLNRANFDLEPHAARAALQLREGPFGPLPAEALVPLGAVGSVPAGLGVVVGDRIPYTKQALAQRDANRADWLAKDPEVKCYLPGVPRATYMPYPLQIFQSNSAFFIAYEYAGATRNVFLADPGPAPIDSWMGQSYGTWDGDTFEVEVTGQNDQTWLDRSGNFHSAELKVVERYQLVSANLLRYEATLTDPQVYLEPWSISMNLYRRQGQDAQLLQFKCVEFVEELLYGHLRKPQEK